jgi:MoaA/NifB/PqqE/SkfB family radical SAM enzyme
MYKTVPIKSIKPVDEYFSIVWQVDLRCNFDCMYCPENFHNLTSPTKTLEQLQLSWTKIFDKSAHKNLKYKISFTGGEVTINKDFLPFIIWLRENYHDHIFQIGVSTNGSAAEKYYLKLIEYIDFITFSTHSEFFNEKKFFENVVACYSKMQDSAKTIHVNIMNESWHNDRIMTYIDFLKEKDISYTLAEIDFTKQIRQTNILNISKQFYDFG